MNRRNQSGNTALHWSSLNGHLATTSALVEAGADLWIRNSAGNLAVFEAERAGKDDVVAYLLKVGGTEKEIEGEGESESESAGTGTGDGDADQVTQSESVDADESVEGASKDMAAANLNG